MKAKLGSTVNSSIVWTILIVLIFDSFVASYSVSPFRYIYDMAFGMIICIVIYTSTLLSKSKEISKRDRIFVLPSFSFFIFVLFNIKTIFSIVRLGIPDIGSLDSNIVVQGMSGLPPLLDYLIITLVNGIVLCIAVNGKSAMHACEIPTYMLCIIAIETSLAMYCFHIAGLNGIRVGLALFHVGICGVVIWLYRKLKTRELKIEVAFPDILLFFLSFGIFMMIYIPNGIYCLFSDNAVIVDSTLSIIYRGSLQPYYVADAHYSPIGGFVSVVFAYLSSPGNILLACSLPFLTGHMMLPFITYHFLKEFVAGDSRIAIIGTAMAILMDGLAVILLPVYIGDLTKDVITWGISPATKSLYFSSICWVWFTPFKIVGMASATSICNILPRRRVVGSLLGGALLGFSFVNPRQTFLAFLVLVFVFGIRKIRLRELAVLLLAALVFLGPILPTVIHKSLESLSRYLGAMSLLLGQNLTQTASGSTLLLAIISVNLILVLVTLISIAFLVCCKFRNERDKKCMAIGNHRLFSGLSISMLVFVIFYAYQYSSNPSIFENNVLVAPLTYIMLRYHILVILIIAGFLELGHNKRMTVTLAVLFSFVYLGLTIKPFLHASLIVVVMALPSMNSFVKSRRKMMISVVLFFVALAIFSASLYSATARTWGPEPVYTDLPHLLNILLNENPGQELFCLSSDRYYATRIAKMAHMRLTSDPSCRLYIIDNRYVSNQIIEHLLSESQVLYHGNVFILLKR